MKTVKILSYILSLSLVIFFSLPFQSCESDDDNEEDEEKDTSVVRKPNIYIYPEQEMELSVRIDFPMGGSIITSLPEYGNGWEIAIKPGGLINNQFNYLFYESTQPDIWQQNKGWIIQKTNLETFFRKNMTNYGFYGQEINDFIDYWIPQMNDYPYYAVYPQTADRIKDVIELNISKQPDKMLRLFYLVKGFRNFPTETPLEPKIPAFKREGFFVAEWGVITR